MIWDSVHPGGSIEVPPKPASCTPAEASLCITTSSFATSVSAGTTKTTATQVKSRCATITGCNLQDVEATKTANACKLTRRAMQLPDLPEATHAPEKRLLVKRSEPSWCNEQDSSDGILLLSMPFSATARAIVEGVLERRDTALKKRDMKNGFEMIQAKHMGFTAFIHVTNLGPLAFDYFNSDEIDEVRRRNHVALTVAIHSLTSIPRLVVLIECHLRPRQRASEMGLKAWKMEALQQSKSQDLRVTTSHWHLPSSRRVPPKQRGSKATTITGICHRFPGRPTNIGSKRMANTIRTMANIRTNSAHPKVRVKRSTSSKAAGGDMLQQ